MLGRAKKLEPADRIDRRDAIDDALYRKRVIGIDLEREARLVTVKRVRVEFRYCLDVLVEARVAGDRGIIDVAVFNVPLKDAVEQRMENANVERTGCGR